MFYVPFLLFAACGLYFSIPYGLIGMAACIILRVISVHSDSERRRRIQMPMDKIVIDGGEIKQSVTKSPLPNHGSARDNG